jgi:hypothetical protein
MPSGLIDEEDGVGSWFGRGDFREVQVHRAEMRREHADVMRADCNKQQLRPGSVPEPFIWLALKVHGSRTQASIRLETTHDRLGDLKLSRARRRT